MYRTPTQRHVSNGECLWLLIATLIVIAAPVATVAYGLYVGAITLISGTVVGAFAHRWS